MIKLLAGAQGCARIRKASYLAGAINILGILFLTRGFTYDGLGNAYPEYFSLGGCFLILLWGCAYIAAARAAVLVPSLLLVFMVEKLFYTGTWFAWFPDHQQLVHDLLSHDPLTAVFLYAYWVNDLFWGVFFGLAAWVVQQQDAGAA